MEGGFLSPCSPECTVLSLGGREGPQAVLNLRSNPPHPPGPVISRVLGVRPQRRPWFLSVCEAGIPQIHFIGQSKGSGANPHGLHFHEVSRAPSPVLWFDLRCLWEVSAPHKLKDGTAEREGLPAVSGSGELKPTAFLFLLCLGGGVRPRCAPWMGAWGPQARRRPPSVSLLCSPHPRK